MQRHPTLLGSCASATTAEEAAYRMDLPTRSPRSTRVVALDTGARRMIERLVGPPSAAIRFLNYEPRPLDEPVDGAMADLVLRTLDGSSVHLSDELAGADFVMMVATTDDGAGAASTIGNACTLRGIMTAGLAPRVGRDASVAVAELRPYARVLLLSDDEQDLAELLNAVGA